MTPLPSSELNDLLFKCFTIDSLGQVALRIMPGALGDDSVNDTHVDWGTGENQISAFDIPIEDTNGYFTTDNVEAALDQIWEAILALQPQ